MQLYLNHGVAFTLSIHDIKLFITIYIFIVETLTYILYHKGKPQNRLTTYRYNEYIGSKTQVFDSLLYLLYHKNWKNNKFRRKL